MSNIAFWRETSASKSCNWERSSWILRKHLVRAWRPSAVNLDWCIHACSPFRTRARGSVLAGTTWARCSLEVKFTVICTPGSVASASHVSADGKPELKAAAAVAAPLPPREGAGGMIARLVGRKLVRWKVDERG